MVDVAPILAAEATEAAKALYSSTHILGNGDVVMGKTLASIHISNGSPLELCNDYI